MKKTTTQIQRIKFSEVCPECQKEIAGLSESQVIYNMETHIRQKHPGVAGPTRALCNDSNTNNSQQTKPNVSDGELRSRSVVIADKTADTLRGSNASEVKDE